MTDFQGIDFVPRNPGARTHKQGTLAAIGYYLNKPWEYLSRGVGKVAGVDLPPAHTFWDQPTLADVIRKTAGAGPDDFGANIAAATADFGLALLLDPINVVRIAGLTKAGKLAKAGDQASKTLELSRFSYLKRVASMATQDGVKGAKLRKTLTKAAKSYDRTKILASDVGDLAAPLGKTLKEQVQRGQRVVFGLDLHDLPAARAVLNKLPFDFAKKISVQGVNIPGLSVKVAEIMDRGKELGGQLAFGAAKGLNKASSLVKLNLNLPTNPGLVRVQKLLDQAAEETSIGKSMNTAVLASRATKFSGSAEKALSVVRELEKRATDPSRVQFIQDLGNFLDNNSVALNKKIFGSEAGRTLAEGVEGSFDSRTLYAPPKAFAGFTKEQTKEARASLPSLFGKSTSLDSHAVSIPGRPRIAFDPDRRIVALEATKLDPGVTKSLTERPALPGVTTFQVVKEGDQKFLVGRMATSTTVSKPTKAHLENLEVLAALWAQKGYTLQDADISDFLFGAGGSVQIVSPSVVQRVKGKGNARLSRAVSQSRRAIARISSRTVDGIYVPTRLITPEIVRGTTVEDYLVKDVASVAKDMELTSKTSMLPTPEVIANLGNNALSHPEVEQAAIDYIKIVKDQNIFHPVVVRLDTRGRFVVFEGMERLKAAEMLGLDNVPIVVQNLAEMDPSKYAKAAKGLSRTIETREGFVEALRAKAGKPTSAAAEKYGITTNGDTFLLNDKLRSVTSASASREYKKARGDFLREQLSELVDFNESPLIQDMRRSVSNTIERRLGTGGEFVTGRRGQPIWKPRGKYVPQRAALNFVQMVDAAQKPEHLVVSLQKLINSEFITPQWVAQHFDNFKSIAADVKNGLSEAGFIGITDDVVAELRTAVARDTSKIALHIDKDGNIAILSRTKTTDELLDVIKGINKKLGRVSGTDVTVIAEGIDGSVSRRLSDFTIQTGAFEPRAQGLSTLLSENFQKDLETKGIFVEKSLKREERISREELNISRAERQSTQHWNPGIKSGFIDPQGSIVYSTKFHKPSDVISTVYGQGPMAVREVFTVHPESGVVVGNIMGLDGSFASLDTRAVNFIEDRVTQLAKKLRKAGFDDRTPLSFVTDLPKTVQDELLPYMTIKSVLDPEFSLKVSEATKGYDLRGVAAVAADDFLKPSTGFKDMDELVDELRQEFSDEFVAETVAGIPVRYREGYYARIFGPGAQEALTLLDDLFESWRRSNQGSSVGFAQFWEHSAFKSRRYSTLTVEEINKVWKEFKDGPGELLKYAKREKHPFLSMLASIDVANGNTGLMEFFVGDPLVAAKVRADTHVAALAQKHLYDSLVENFAVAHGTPDEVFSTLRPQQKISKLQDKLAGINQELGRVKQVMDDTPENLVAKEADDYIKKLEGQAQEVSAEIADVVSKRVNDNGLFGADLDAAGGVFMSKTDARALIDNPDFPGITADSLLESDSPFVVLRTEDVRTLSGTGTKVAIFPHEIVGYLQRHFDLMSNRGGASSKFLREFFDPIQSVFKKLALFSAPRMVKFVARNVFSDSVRMWVAGVDMPNVAEAWRTLGKTVPDFLRGRDPAVFKTLMSHVFIGDLGQAAPFKEVFDEFVQRGGVTTGLVRGVDRVFNEIRVPSEVWGFLRERGWAGSMDAVLPLAVRNRAANVGEHLLFKTGQRLATATETINRFGVFIDGWKKTGDFDHAMKQVQMIMYDYDKLLAAERRGLQRVFPFWAWTRNNIPFSLKYFALEPIKHLQLTRGFADVARGAGGYPAPDDVPAHLQSILLLPVFRKDGILYTSVQDNFMPMAILAKMFGPEGGLFDAAKGEITGGLSPIIQYPVELLTGTSMFTGQKLELAPGQPARSGTLSSLGFTQTPTASGPLGVFNLIANQFNLRKIPAATQLLKGLDMAMGYTNARGEKDIPVTAALMDWLLSSVLAIDPVKARNINQIRKTRLQSQFKAIYNWGVKTGRRDLVDFASKHMLLNELSQEPN